MCVSRSDHPQIPLRLAAATSELWLLRDTHECCNKLLRGWFVIFCILLSILGMYFCIWVLYLFKMTWKMALQTVNSSLNFTLYIFLSNCSSNHRFLSSKSLSLSLSLLPPFLTPRCTFTHTVLVPPHSLFKNNAETACIPSLNHLRVTQALSHVITHHADASVTACFLQTKPAFV